jgi:hypothetical protein
MRWEHLVQGVIERNPQRGVWMLYRPPYKNGKPRKPKRLGLTLNQACGKLCIQDLFGESE